MFLAGIGTQIGARLRMYCAKKQCEKGLGEFFSRQYHGRTIDYVRMPFKDGQITLTQAKKNGLILYERVKGNTSGYEFKSVGNSMFNLFSGGFKL